MDPLAGEWYLQGICFRFACDMVFCMVTGKDVVPQQLILVL